MLLVEIKDIPYIFSTSSLERQCLVPIGFHSIFFPLNGDQKLFSYPHSSTYQCRKISISFECSGIYLSIRLFHQRQSVIFSLVHFYALVALAKSLTQVSKCELNVLGELLHFADMQQCSDVPANSCEECVILRMFRKMC